MTWGYNDLMVCVWTLYGCSFLVTAGRAVERFSRGLAFQIEDLTLYFGLACLTALAIVQTIMTPKFVAVSDLVLKSITDPAVMTTPQAASIIADTSTGLKLMFTQMFLFFTVLFAAKFSLLFFFRRLIIGLPRYMWIWWATFVIIMLLYLASMASNLLTCTPLEKYWSSTGCNSLDDRRKADKSIRFATGVDIAADGLIMLLPLSLLRQLQLARRQKAGLAGVFMVGLAIIIFAIVRLIEVTQATQAVQQDPTKVAESPIKLSAWSFIEGSVSIIVASLPTFRFLHQRASTRKSSNNKSPGYKVRDVGQSLHTIGSAGPNRVKRSHPDDSLFETLVDDDNERELKTFTSYNGEIGVAKTYDGKSFGGGITKQVGYSIREEPASDEDERRQQPYRHTNVSHGNDQFRGLRRDSSLVIQSNAV